MWVAVASRQWQAVGRVPFELDSVQGHLQVGGSSKQGEGRARMPGGGRQAGRQARGGGGLGQL